MSDVGYGRPSSFVWV